MSYRVGRDSDAWEGSKKSACPLFLFPWITLSGCMPNSVSPVAHEVEQEIRNMTR